MQKILLRNWVSTAPEGKEKIRWYGPGLMWMLSAVGTGSILFTPRVASLYQYQLLWLMLLVVFFMWVMIREMARFSVVTGYTMLEGMHTLKGPRDWAIWIIYIPQLIAAAVGIAGLCAVVGSTLGNFLPGSNLIYGLLVLFACTGLTGTGKYAFLERISRNMAIVLLLMVVVSAAVMFPGISEVTSGFQIQWPTDSDLYVILPWVGTILAGSMGIVWFGYWTATRGYGGGLAGREGDEEVVDRENKSKYESQARQTRIRRASDWLPISSGTAALGTITGLIVLVSFMILGAELLAPKNLLPQGTDVAIDLAVMLSEIWGPTGKWLMIIIVVIALAGSVLANQDGWGRSFADMTLIFLRSQRYANSPGPIVRLVRKLECKMDCRLLTRIAFKRFYIAVVTGIIPAIILIIFQDPVKVMSASGIIAAAHTPFIVFLALYVNLTRLPKPLRPSGFYVASMMSAGIFYLGFAVLYILT
ncbi:MAG: Nramp family divalent metal transporter [Desulfuromonadaceae bacterium]